MFSSAADATTLETKIKTTGLLTGTAGVKVVSFQRDGGSIVVPPTLAAWNEERERELDEQSN